MCRFSDYALLLWRTSGPVLDLHLVHVLADSGLDKLLESPCTLRQLVRLGLTAATSVRVVLRIHGHTSRLWTEASVPTTTSFTPGNSRVFWVGHHSQRGVAVFVHVAVLARAQADGYKLPLRVF